MEARFDVDGDIGRITLSGPGGNALDRPDFVELDDLTRFFATSALRGVILQGSGRSFCSGASKEGLARLKAAPSEHSAAIDRGRALLEAIACAPVPVVAAIRGSCLGGGLELALACQFRVASRNAILGFPETGEGIFPGLGGLPLLTETVGRHRALELVLSGRLVTGEEAFASGLVDELTATGDLAAGAELHLRRLIGDRPSYLVRAVMAATAGALRLPRVEALEQERELFLEVARKAPRGDDGPA